MPTPLTQTSHQDFATDLNQRVQALRGALTELMVSSGEALKGGQDLARRYKINRNVAWKLNRIIKTADAQRACAHLPGEAGMKIVLESIEKTGVAPDTVARLRTAWDGVCHLIEVHASDRATFDLMLSSMSRDSQGASIEASRRSAFEGNSAIWGVQAETLYSTLVVAPHASDPDYVDFGLIGGLVDFRRLRPTADWVLGKKVLRTLTVDGHLPQEEAVSGEPIDGLPLIGDFCSKPIPEIRAIPEAGSTRYVLPAGAVGNPGALTCAFGWIQRRAVLPGSAMSKRMKDPEDFLEHFVRIGTPVRWAQIDVLIHEDLAPPVKPGLVHYDLVHGPMAEPLTRNTDFHLPFHESVESLGVKPPIVISKHVRRYEDLMGLTTRRMGWGLDSFAAYRVTMAFPPLQTALLLSLPASVFARD